MVTLMIVDMFVAAIMIYAAAIGIAFVYCICKAVNDFILKPVTKLIKKIFPWLDSNKG